MRGAWARKREDITSKLMKKATHNAVAFLD